MIVGPNNLVLLSPHFSLIELSMTQVRGIDNTPPGDVLLRLENTAAGLEEIRSLLGDLPIHINSGYRSPGVNKAVGGVADSAHIYGNAADFVCPSFGTPLEICAKISGSALDFDQCIQEGTWVHISFDPKMRREVLTKTNNGYKIGL